jgi:hypothetical protein
MQIDGARTRTAARAVLPNAALTLLPLSMLGFLKYSKIAARCSVLTEATSHITRNKAIIAVTKFAYATFYAPP